MFTRQRQIIAVSLLAAMFLVGCQPSKKIMPAPTPKKQSNTKLAQLSSGERRTLISRLSNAAVAVEGISRAIVVLSSDNNNDLVVLVGLTLKPGNKNGTGQIKQKLIDRLRRVDKRVTQVLVTTDPNMVKRVSDIASGIIEGNPLKSSARDVTELNRQLKK